MNVCLEIDQKLIQATSLIRVLEIRAKTQSSQIAYTFLEDGETEAGTLTYQNLAQQVQAIAAHLHSCVLPGERALLLYPAGLEFVAAFLGCLAAGVIAVPANLPKRNQKLSRIEAIIQNAQATMVLTTQSLLTSLKSQLERNLQLTALEYVATDTLTHDSSLGLQSSTIRPDSLAFLQYTSGSTGKPKGVMVTQENLLQNLADLDLGWEHTQKSVMVTWLPTFHDMGLIYGMLLPLYKGFPCYMMPPSAFLQRPIRWLTAISRYRATHSAAPNFAYTRCLEKITPEQIATLDLSSWQVALNGAEPVRAEVLEQFAQTFEPSGFKYSSFCPGYGLAEATLKVAAIRKSQKPQICRVQTQALKGNRIIIARDEDQGIQHLVSCGQTEIDTEIVIVNPNTLKRCADDEVGEIWVKGTTVAQGYWQRPEETQHTFKALIADTQEGPFLRTGDLGFIQEGQLYVTGRLKDVMIIRGCNYYPQDIEHTVEQSHPALRSSCGAAFTVEINGEEHLVIAQEIERTALRQLNKDEVIEAIRRAVSQEYQLQAHAILLLKPASIAKTSSGKIQRSTCRTQFLENSCNLVDSWHEPSTFPTPSSTNVNVSTMKATPTTSADVSQQRADKMINWLRDYAKTRINSQLIDERRCIPPYIVMDFGNQGIMGMQIPEQYGGIALNHRDFLRVMEQLAAIDLTLATMVSLNNSLGIRPIMGYATPKMKDELLPRLAQGRELSSFGMTEPDAGANIGSIATIAVPDDQGGWKLRGVKRWNGSAWAGMINVFVRLVDRNSGHSGLTGFIVRQGTPGLRLGKESLTMGLRGIMQNAIYFDDVQVSRENLLGELGNGTEAADDALLFARLGIGMMSIGGMKRCLQLMLRYTSRRSVATGRLLDNPVTLARLDHLTGATVALETLLQLIAEALDRQEVVPREAAVIAKIIGADYLWEAADSLVQMLGGRGYMETNLAPQILRDARVLRIGEGPNESLKIFLGKSITHTDKLHQFLTTYLGANQLANQLQEAAAAINHRCLKSKAFGDRSAAIAWSYSLIGELACYALLVGATEKASRSHPCEQINHALAWSRLQFEESLHKALKGAGAESLLSNVNNICDRIAGYSHSVDDIEQRLAGVDHTLDELIAQDPRPSASFSPTPILSEPISDESNPTLSQNHHNGNSHHKITNLTHQTPASIEKWICDWLHKKLKVDPDTIIPSKSFADFGLDSIYAVELAQDLEDWSQEPLEATIIWNFPTIEALTKHIAEKLNASVVPAATISTNVAAEKLEVEELLSALDGTSDEEMAALLGR
ncbi:MAG: AMP-binding protein [Desmonostoc geniculatum HA4340-LM1]|jgi:acyl-CoA synthetase (AMP-forming)/AMP-acid ligase II/alkylation response protein AidB-like acyl-CoA dehydrogenase/acyl carrier protein|nr:AMP-binding protein [Desmonostoc geniculatum HA4340-LM1]